MADPASVQESRGDEGAVSPTTTVSTTSSPEAKSIDTVILEQEEAKKVAAPPVAEPSPVPTEPSPVPTEPSPVPKELATVPTEPTPVSTEPTPVPTEVNAVEAPKPSPPEAVDNGNKTEQSNGVPKDTDDWQRRESELLNKIDELEKVKNERSEDGLKLELKLREEEIDLLKARVRNLETELQAAMSKPSGKNHEMIENIKQQHEELLSKARGMIFDKTKMVKNQELQIEALTTQVQSLKDINMITKDLLEIRNSEIKAMEERLQAMEERFKKEKERFGLVLQRAQTSTNINDDLRKEYETQLAIFKELREKYEQRVQALASENKRLKDVHEAKEAVRNAQDKAGTSG